MSNSCNPMDCSLPDSSVQGILQQKYWRGLPFPSPRDLPDPGIKPGSPVLKADSLLTEIWGKPSELPDSPQYISLLKVREKGNRKHNLLQHLQTKFFNVFPWILEFLTIYFLIFNFCPISRRVPGTEFKIFLWTKIHEFIELIHKFVTNFILVESK